MPDGFSLGTEYTAEEINAALQMHALDRYRLIPSRDLTGHGTAVAGIAAGKSADGLYTGAAPEAELIVVKLGLPGNSGGRRRRIPSDNRNPAWSDLCAAESQTVKYASCHQFELR